MFSPLRLKILAHLHYKRTRTDIIRSSAYHPKVGSFFSTDFPCPANSLPLPPPNGTARKIQSGMKFSPCTGIYSSDYVEVPSVTAVCSGIKVLIKDDYSFREYDTIYTKTLFMFDFTSENPFVYLRFSKDVHPEDIQVI